MKFAAIAALIATAATYTPTVEQIMLEAEKDEEKKTVKEIAEATAETDSGAFLVEKKICVIKADVADDAEDWKVYQACLTDRKNTIVYDGNKLVKESEASKANGDCKDAYDEVEKVS